MNKMFIFIGMLSLLSCVLYYSINITASRDMELNYRERQCLKHNKFTYDNTMWFSCKK